MGRPSRPTCPVSDIGPRVQTYRCRHLLRARNVHCRPDDGSLASLLALQPRLEKKNKPRGFLNAKKDALRYHEDIIVFYKRLPPYFPQMISTAKPIHACAGKRLPLTTGVATAGTTNVRDKRIGIRVQSSIFRSSTPKKIRSTRRKNLCPFASSSSVVTQTRVRSCWIPFLDRGTIVWQTPWRKRSRDRKRKKRRSNRRINSESRCIDFRYARDPHRHRDGARNRGSCCCA